jgi:amino acid permease
MMREPHILRTKSSRKHEKETTTKKKRNQKKEKNPKIKNNKTKKNPIKQNHKQTPTERQIAVRHVVMISPPFPSSEQQP